MFSNDYNYSSLKVIWMVTRSLKYPPQLFPPPNIKIFELLFSESLWSVIVIAAWPTLGQSDGGVWISVHVHESVKNIQIIDFKNLKNNEPRQKEW